MVWTGICNQFMDAISGRFRRRPSASSQSFAVRVIAPEAPDVNQRLRCISAVRAKRNTSPSFERLYDGVLRPYSLDVFRFDERDVGRRLANFPGVAGGRHDNVVKNKSVSLTFSFSRAKHSTGIIKRKKIRLKDTQTDKT
jgi:hypothetical protein